jgi:hypothetical protein
MDEAWLRFALAALACWRLAALLAYDDGPWDVVLRLRRAIGDGPLGRMLDCFRCLSLWVAAPLAFAVTTGALNLVLVWLALSGAACLLDRLTQPALTLQRLQEDGETDELLRTESQRAGASDAEPYVGRGAAEDDGPLHVVR